MGTSEGARKGHTPDADAKRSEAMKRRWGDPEYKARLSAKFKASMTPETKAKHSDAQKRVRADTEDKARRAEIEARPETKVARQAGAQKRWARPGERERQSDALKRSWENPSPERLKGLDAIMNGMPVSSLEKLVIPVLIERGVDFIVHKRIGRYQADFYVPELNLDIECDGRYWHLHPDRVASDAKRDAWLVCHGYAVLHLSEEEITAGDFTRLDEIISK